MKKRWILICFYEGASGCWVPNPNQTFEDKESALVEFGKTEMQNPGLMVCETIFPKEDRGQIDLHGTGSDIYEAKQ